MDPNKVLDIARNMLMRYDTEPVLKRILKSNKLALHTKLVNNAQFNVNIYETFADIVLRDIKKDMASIGVRDKKLLKDCMLVLKSEMMSNMWFMLNFEKKVRAT